MNCFYHSIYDFLFALLIISSIVYNQVVISKRYIQSHDLIRRKRIWNGTEIKDNKFPYVVYIRIIYFEDNMECPGYKCTGTLIHPRFVVTTKNCILKTTNIVVKNRIIVGSNIKIFLKRPYDELNMNNISYNIGSNVELTHNVDTHDVDDIALILMNDTFPEINKFPVVLMLDPIPYGKTLSCTTVGFSFIGTNFSQPIADLVGPTSYEFTAEFSITNCLSAGWNKKRIKDVQYANAFLCFTGPEPLGRSLCNFGDEGSPLLCKLHEGSKIPERSQPSVDNNGNIPSTSPKQKRADGDGVSGSSSGEELGLYGIGVHRDINNCDHSSQPLNTMFLYTLKYGTWINDVLNDFDDHQNRKNHSSTTVGTTIDTRTTTTTTPIPLPEYYDTDVYDDTSKKPKRCNDADFSWFAIQNHPSHCPSDGPVTTLVFWSLIAIITMST